MIRISRVKTSPTQTNPDGAYQKVHIEIYEVKKLRGGEKKPVEERIPAFFFSNCYTFQPQSGGISLLIFGSQRQVVWEDQSYKNYDDRTAVLPPWWWSVEKQPACAGGRASAPASTGAMERAGACGVRVLRSPGELFGPPSPGRRLRKAQTEGMEERELLTLWNGRWLDPINRTAGNREWEREREIRATSRPCASADPSSEGENNPRRRKEKKRKKIPRRFAMYSFIYLLAFGFNNE